MINEDGSPNTAHTTNPVPFFIIDNSWRGHIEPGKLGDLAPTILHMMGLPIPVEMNGNILTRDSQIEVIEVSQQPAVNSRQ